MIIEALIFVLENAFFVCFGKRIFCFRNGFFFLNPFIINPRGAADWKNSLAVAPLPRGAPRRRRTSGAPMQKDVKNECVKKSSKPEQKDVFASILIIIFLQYVSDDFMNKTIFCQKINCVRGAPSI